MYLTTQTYLTKKSEDRGRRQDKKKKTPKDNLHTEMKLFMGDYS